MRKIYIDPSQLFHIVHCQKKNFISYCSIHTQIFALQKKFILNFFQVKSKLIINYIKDKSIPLL
jgi:hypothetical protein